MQTLEIQALNLRYAPLRVMDPGRRSRLAASMAREGQRSPVVVVQESVLVDGYHRVAALSELGRDLVTAVSLELSEAEALVMAWQLETGRRKTALEEGWLIAELMESHGRTAGALATEMRRSKSWVSERLGLVRVLPEGVQEAVRQAKIPAHGAMRALVPMARIDRGATEAMVTHLPEPVTVRELERLWSAWRSADAVGRARIVENPTLLLKTDDKVGDVNADDEERLAGQLEAVAGLCRRARQQVSVGVFARANRTLVRRSWVAAREAFRSLEEEVGRVGPRDT